MCRRRSLHGVLNGRFAIDLDKRLGCRILTVEVTVLAEEECAYGNQTEEDRVECELLANN